MKPIYKKCAARMLLFIVYGCSGGWILSLVEKRDEKYSTTSMRLLDNLRKEMNSKYNMTNLTDFDRLLRIVTEASQLKRKMDWTFLNGCEFAFTALTTVGYGNITPQTPLGQALSILFCVIGLPICMLALKTAGEVISMFMYSITKTLNERLFHYKSRDKENTFRCVAMIFVWLLALICIMSTVEMYLEGWTFIEGFYCWFVTFTTIGFGDFVPFQKYKIENEGHTGWILILLGAAFTIPYTIGLCLVSSLLNLLVQFSESIKVSVNIITSCVPCGSNTSNNEVEAALSNEVRLQSFINRRFSV